MDEPRTQPEGEAAAAAARTTLGRRFCGFAMAHICYDLLGVAVLWLVLFTVLGNVDDMTVFTILAALFGSVSMVIYFPLGLLAAWWGDWSVPTAREKVWAVLQPCLISVSWAALTLWSLPHSGTNLLFTLMLPVSMTLAAPSSFFFACCLFVCRSWNLSALLAAVLPPLLFALGSFWQAERRGDREEETATDEAGE